MHIHHRTFAVASEDISACYGFYTSLLGFDEVEPEEPNSIQFAQGARLYWGQGADHPVNEVTSRHFAVVLGTDVYHSVKEACQKHGCYLYEGRYYWNPAWQRCHVHDPAGNRVVIIERAPEDADGRQLPYIHHWTFVLPDTPMAREEMHGFYQDVIGMTPIGSRVPEAVWFAEGFHYYWGTGIDHPPRTPTIGHMALDVNEEEFDTIFATCHRRGLTLPDLEERPDRGVLRRAYVADPFNNRIELIVE